jgi:hypothetical protein
MTVPLVALATIILIMFAIMCPMAVRKLGVTGVGIAVRGDQLRSAANTNAGRPLETFLLPAISGIHRRTSSRL